MNRKRIIISAVIAVALIGGTIAFAAFNQEEKNENNEITTAEVTTVEQTTADPNIGKSISRLTGDYVETNKTQRRPVALMFNNIKDAIPQSGISNASVIYEAPVEGCITRLMGIFEDYDNLKKIGSVRSCRIYYCYFALEWDAIYTHFGQSKYALDFLKSDKIDNIGSYQPVANEIFYRTTDRVAPHNCYISGKGINKGISTLKYRKKYKKNSKPHFSFAQYGTKIQLQNDKVANKVEIGYQINKPWFEYDSKTGQYKRFQYGDKHIDDQNKSQLTCSNIIIQYVDATLFPDNKSLNMTLTGKGKGWYITNGKAEKIKWKKSDQFGKTVYTDKDGKEIVLNTGKTWVCMVQNEYKGNVKISK